MQHSEILAATLDRVQKLRDDHCVLTWVWHFTRDISYRYYGRIDPPIGAERFLFYFAIAGRQFHSYKEVAAHYRINFVSKNFRPIHHRLSETKKEIDLLLDLMKFVCSFKKSRHWRADLAAACIEDYATELAKIYNIWIAAQLRQVRAHIYCRQNNQYYEVRRLSLPRINLNYIRPNQMIFEYIYPGTYMNPFIGATLYNYDWDPRKSFPVRNTTLLTMKPADCKRRAINECLEEILRPLPDDVSQMIRELVYI